MVQSAVKLYVFPLRVIGENLQSPICGFSLNSRVGSMHFWVVIGGAVVFDRLYCQRPALNCGVSSLRALIAAIVSKMPTTHVLFILAPRSFRPRQHVAAFAEQHRAGKYPQPP